MYFKKNKAEVPKQRWWTISSPMEFSQPSANSPPDQQTFCYYGYWFRLLAHRESWFWSLPWLNSGCYSCLCELCLWTVDFLLLKKCNKSRNKFYYQIPILVKSLYLKMAMQIQWAPKYRDICENGDRDIVPALAVNKQTPSILFTFVHI